ncbi:hypothetical protein JTE90_027519 [Oedothorax gibbosus]|uniref:Uncharacterized protein n=1 Tax=Oedothorax gibbosus TaxID=931172 RepID=A0AAV6VM82_9ARAC|nr:hypothetical protein JTE90_027519 [Oedothorax gibbosus]
MSEEVKEVKKVRKVADDFINVVRDWFTSKYSINGVTTHNRTNWTAASEHCRGKGKILFNPQSWKEVEDVWEHIKRRVKEKPKKAMGPKIPLTLIGIKLWTGIETAGIFPFITDTNKTWLNDKINEKISVNLAIQNQTFCVAIKFTESNITAEVEYKSTNLNFFCEKLQKTTDENPVSSRTEPYIYTLLTNEEPPEADEGPTEITKEQDLTTVPPRIEEPLQLTLPLTLSTIHAKDKSKITTVPSKTIFTLTTPKKILTSKPTKEFSISPLTSVVTSMPPNKMSTEKMSTSNSTERPKTSISTIGTSDTPLTSETVDGTLTEKLSTEMTSIAGGGMTSFSEPTLMSTSTTSKLPRTKTINEDNTVESTVKKSTTTPQVTNVEVLETKSTMDETVNTVTEHETTFQETENTVEETVSTMTENDTTVRETEYTVNDTVNIDAETEYTVHETENPLTEYDTTVHESENTVNDVVSTVTETEYTVYETENSVTEYDTTVQESEYTVDDIVSTVTMNATTVPKTEKTVKQTENTMTEYQETETAVNKTLNPVIECDITSPIVENASSPEEEISETLKTSSFTTQNIFTSTQENYKPTEQILNLTIINVNITEDSTLSTEKSSSSTSISTSTAIVTSTEETSSSCEAKRVMYKGLEIRLPETNFGQVAEPPCPRGTYGAIRWKCNEILGYFEKNGYVSCQTLNCSEKLDKPSNPNDTEYLSYEVTRLFLCEDDDDDQENKTINVLDQMKQKRKAYKGKDVLQESFDPGKVKKDMSMMLDVYDRLMDKDAKVWNKMKKTSRRSTSMEIMKETEETAWTIGCLMQEASMKKDNLAVQVFSLKADQSADMLLALSTAEIGSVRLPGNLRARTDGMCRTSNQKGVVSAYKNVQYLDPNNSFLNISSGVIGVSVDQFSTTYHLPENETVRLVLYHPKMPKDAKALCVFLDWNATKEEDFGIWNPLGCNAVGGGDNFTVCECNHLTNFAVLMDFREHEASEEDQNVLNILSVIFCSLSSIALLLTIIIYLTIRSLRSRRSTITCNLAICLLGMNILVQTGFDRVSTIACKITSALIQYCVLSAFFWMLLEGALLYKMVIVVFETKKISLKVLYAIAYGIPFFIVTLSSAVGSDTMIRKHHCWPSSKRGHIWSVMGPIVLVISVNLIILCLTLNAASKIDRMNTTKSKMSNEDRKRIVKQRMKGVFSLMCLLGFTWTVGFLQGTKTSFAQYIFVIVNGLQGVFLFVSQVILNDNVYKKLFAIYKENFARFSSKTSSWNLMASMKAKPNLEIKPIRKEEKSVDEFSSICIEEPEDQKIKSFSPNISHEDLCKVRLRIMELAKEQRELHPFGLNQDHI